jgi:hypothetical protein
VWRLRGLMTSLSFMSLMDLFLYGRRLTWCRVDGSSMDVFP